MGQNPRMSWIPVFLLAVAIGLSHSQYEDYGSDYDWSSGSGDYGSASTTTNAPTLTTKKPTATTKAPPSGKTVVFPKLASPIAGYKYTKVFGVPVFAHTSVSDAKFQHVASIMAEWLDNDEDGCVDTPIILKHLVGKTSNEVTAYAVVKSNKAKANWYAPFDKKNLVCSAPQSEFETEPKCTGLKGTNVCSDATLEEVWMGTRDDLATKYKNVNSTLVTLLDAARGGIPRVPAVPKGAKFPAKAYYTYDDKSCKFSCQAIEYWWWSTAA